MGVEPNYRTICHSNLLKGLPERQRDIIGRRFGLGAEKETLESIGEIYSITRERVRQIEDDGLKRLRGRLEDAVVRRVFQSFIAYFQKAGSLRREDLILADLGGKDFQNYVYFLLTLGEPFFRFSETEDLHPFWTTNKNISDSANKVIHAFIKELEKKRQPLSLPLKTSPSFIEISKTILRGQDNLYGLKDWPELNPRGVKDKAYVALKKEKKPLHFSEVARLLGEGVVVQTVHNELIRDPRFVLVGRGLYALKEWGYQSGVVKEVIARVLEKSPLPLGREAILAGVLEQRLVKPTTVLLNLQDRKYFIKNSDGKYTIRRA